MKSLFLCLALSILCCTCKAWKELFQKHVEEYNLQYDAEQHAYRYEVFKNNMDLIEAHNAKTGTTFTMGRGPFTHYTIEEFNKYASSGRFDGEKTEEYRSLDAAMPVHRVDSVDLPSSFDWRNTPGVVTPVKNQGQCGSCWTFGASGAMEGAYAVASGYKRSAYNVSYEDPVTGFYGFSEQFSASCDMLMSDGCNGGEANSVFVYVANAGGIPSELTYPYTFIDGPPPGNPTGNCSATMSAPSGFVPYSQLDKGRPYTNVQPYSVESLQSAVSMQPVHIAVQAGPSYPGAPSPWQNYAGGIVTVGDGCGQDLDHSVLVVGWNTDAATGMDYWIIKNSWTADWGESGYIYVEKSKANACGVLSEPSFPNMMISPPDTPAPTAPPTVNSDAQKFTGYISSDSSSRSKIQIPGLSDIRQVRVDSMTINVNDASISPGNTITAVVSQPLMGQNTAYGIQTYDGMQSSFFAAAILADNYYGSQDAYIAICELSYYPGQSGDTVSFALYLASRYENFTLPMSDATLFVLAAGAYFGDDPRMVPVQTSNSITVSGLSVSNPTFSLQSTWPTAAPTQTPAPTPPLPSGNFIMATFKQTLYTESSCTDSSKALYATASTYGLCVLREDGSYLRSVPGVPAVTNPDDPITVPIYASIYSDAQCTNQTSSLPTASLKANYCALDQPGTWFKYEYVVSKNDGNFEVAPASQLVNPMYAYNSASDAGCAAHDLTSVTYYRAIPVLNKCTYSPINSEYARTTCMDGTLYVNSYDNNQCSGSAETKPVLEKTDCDGTGESLRMWTTSCGPSPSPRPTPKPTPPAPASDDDNGGGSSDDDSGGGSGGTPIAVSLLMFATSVLPMIPLLAQC